MSDEVAWRLVTQDEAPALKAKARREFEKALKQDKDAPPVEAMKWWIERWWRE